MYGVKFTLRLVTLVFALLLLLTVLVQGENGGNTVHQRAKRFSPEVPPEIAISMERIQLLDDAMGWMTFRKHGHLMSKEQLAAVFLPLSYPKERYRYSEFYRTFVIAFQYGVLPRLTLNENEECDSDYIWQYKDPFSSTVSWYFQKRFTFKAFKERESSTQKFCDYRQGLICKPATNKCECPEGSKMQEISPGSPVKRCLLEENEICALIDLAHGQDRYHDNLVSNLHHIIFNLEKPVSCQHGTQCRFKSQDITFSRCYNVNSGPWAPPYVDKFGNTMDTWTLDFGEPCVLGLIASPGSCRELGYFSHSIGLFEGYTCFNFGPPRSQLSGSKVPENRTGFCAHYYAPYGIADVYGGDIDWVPKIYLPLFSPFVTPRTVPLRGRDLETFFQRYLKLHQYFFPTWDKSKDLQEETEGARCSVKKTEIWEKSWRYFASLMKDDPPAGQDFVPQATPTKLNAHLEAAIDLTKHVSAKVCQIFHTYDRWGHYGQQVAPDEDPGTWKPSLKCVAQGAPDAAGNDGVCVAPGNIDTKADDERFRRFQKHIKDVDGDYDNTDRGILEKYPDGLCLPALGPAGRSLGDVLEGGYCADDAICYKDYRNTNGKYDQWCNLQSPAEDLDYVCHESGDDVQYSECESQWQDKLLTQEVPKVGEYATLSRGESCAYNIEKSVRNWIVDEPFETNKYKVLNWLEKTMLPGAEEGGFCDRTKLLECKDTGICECLENTQPRMVTVDGVKYHSDYCYLATGACDRDPTTLKLQYSRSGESNPSRLTEWEKQRIWNWTFYGNKQEEGCERKNLCVYLNPKRQECSASNTGKTGYDFEHAPEPEPEPEPHLAPSRPGWRIGGGCILRISDRLAGSLLLVTFMFTQRNYI